MIQYPADSEPHIKWNHIDGPLLVQVLVCRGLQNERTN
jgi:hypothetical protein